MLLYEKESNLFAAVTLLWYASKGLSKTFLLSILILYDQVSELLERSSAVRRVFG